MSVTSSKITDVPKTLKNRYLLNSNKRVVMFQLVRADIKNGKCPRSENIPGKDVVWDEKKGEAYEIYHDPRVKIIEGVGKIEGKDIFAGSDTGGIIRCNLETRQGRLMYEYLCMSNYNASNPFRDKSKKKIVKMVNVEAEAKRENQMEEARIKAQAKVFNMDTEALRRMSDWAGIDSTSSPVVLKRNLLNLAKTKTTEFDQVARIVDEYGEYLSAVVRGQRHNIIEANRSAGKWRWSDTKIFFAPYSVKDEHSTNVVRLAEYFKNGEESGKHYQKLVKELKKFEGLYQA